MSSFEAEKIKADLQPLIEGDIVIDEITRYLLSTDGSFYKIIPTAVVYPKNENDVVKVARYCYKNKISIHPRGGGSGLGGQSLGKGIILDFTKYMNKIVSIDFEKQEAIVEPGVRLGELEKKLREKGFFFPPDPSSRDYCTIGGNIGTNASGSHSVKYGNVSDYVESLEVVLFNGEKIITGNKTLEQVNTLPESNEKRIYKEMITLLNENDSIINSHYPKVRFNVSGYELRGLIINESINLTRVFVGSEGTLGIVVKAKLRFRKAPKYTALIVAYFDDLEKAGKAVWETLQKHPSAIEIMDKTLLDLARAKYPSLDKSLPRNLKYMLLIEFDGNNLEKLNEESKNVAVMLKNKLNLAFHVAASTDPQEQKLLWETRKAAVPLLYKLNLDGRKIVGFIEDGAVPPETLPKYMLSLYAISQKYDIPMAIYGHASKGLLHVRPFVNLKDPIDIEKMEKIMVEVAEIIWELKGTVSGEHGDGRVRSFLMKKQYGPLYEVFKQVKNVFDPVNILNPDVKTGNKQNKMIVPGEVRYGPEYKATVFPDFILNWENDEFQEVVETCHGCSKCTTVTSVTRMCPVYKQIREEYASPKAKANVWRGIISSELPIEDTLNSPIFKQLMFDCVGCQSCYLECPSNVNIPKLALEGKAQIVKRQGIGLREKLLSSFGIIGRISSPVAPIINFFASLKISKWLVEKTLKITKERELPRFQKKSFIKQFRHKYGERYVPEGPVNGKVVYFVGCSANLTDPQIGESLVNVLAKNNVEVVVPKQNCCGVPMIANGDIERAKKYALKNIQQLYPYVEQGYDVIVTCSSCGLALKQEWNDLLSSEEAKIISKNTYHFSEYLLKLKEKGKLNEDFEQVNVSLGYHWSCHLKAQKDAKDKSYELLKIIPGVSVTPIDEGCCGIAGTWGYKKENYDLSIKIGSGLIKKLKETEIQYGSTDRPTCKLQMEHGSKKAVLHPVEIIAKAYKNNAPREKEE